MQKYSIWVILSKLGRKKQTRVQNVAERQNNVKPYEIYSIYIELSKVFHTMIIFWEMRKFNFCQEYL